MLPQFCTLTTRLLIIIHLGYHALDDFVAFCLIIHDRSHDQHAVIIICYGPLLFVETIVSVAIRLYLTDTPDVAQSRDEIVEVIIVSNGSTDTKHTIRRLIDKDILCQVNALHLRPVFIDKRHQENIERRVSPHQLLTIDSQQSHSIAWQIVDIITFATTGQHQEHQCYDV